MALSNLTDIETEIVFECLRCVATGEIILDDFEFDTLIGIDFESFGKLVGELPRINESDQETHLAINNSLVNLLWYPHGCHAKWSNYISVPQSEVARILAKWRGETINNYFEGIQ